MKVSELIAKANPTVVARAKNLSRIDWIDGYLLVWFRGKPTLWVYGPNIPEEERDKILRVPYPDKLFTTNIKNKYQCHRVNRAA